MLIFDLTSDWLLAPGLLLLVSFGLGILLCLAIRKRLNVAILTVLGFLLIVLTGSLCTASTVVAPIFSDVIAIVGLAGIVTWAMRFRKSFPLDWPSSIAGLVTYFLYALPSLASGKPGWVGWVKLDDTGTWLALSDRLVNVGHMIPDPITSTYDRVIQIYMGNSAFGSAGSDYPLGSFLPLGVMSKISHIDAAWLFQPYLALAAGISAALFTFVVRRFISNRIWIVALSSLAVLASSMYSYVMWGGIKEVVLLIPISLLALTLFRAGKTQFDLEFFLSAGITLLSLFFIAGKSSAGFILPIIGCAIMVWLFQRNRGVFRAVVGIGAGVSFLLLILLLSGNDVIGKILVPPNGGDVGNLSRSLSLLQVMGIWPNRDFRMDALHPQVTYLIIAFAILFAIAGLYFAIKQRKWAMPSLVATCILVVAYSNRYGGIWFTAKAIAVASPFLLLASCIGSYELWNFFGSRDRERPTFFKSRYVVAMVALTVGFGVVVSDCLTFGNVWLSPYTQVSELQTIGKLYAGQGPALMTEYSVLGSRYFLRALDAESASELRVHTIPMLNGATVPKGYAADVELFGNATLDYFNLLVLRNSPLASRPPMNFDLVWSGKLFNVWKKNSTSVNIKKTLPLGTNESPGSVPQCQAVTAFLAGMSPGDRVFTVDRSEVFPIALSDAQLPANWTPSTPPAGSVDRNGSGTLSKFFRIGSTGDYDLSIAGSFPGHLKLMLDAENIYSGTGLFEGNPTLTNSLTNIHLTEGSHVLTLVYSMPILAPGSFVGDRIGPIYLTTQLPSQTQVVEVPASDYSKLCQRNLDWITIAQ